MRSRRLAARRYYLSITNLLQINRSSWSATTDK